MSFIPKRFTEFTKKYPEIADSYEKMGKAVHMAGPLDDKTRALIKLALSTGAGKEGAVHSHVRKAIETGCSAEEIRHVILLALPTLGFPSMMAAMSWADDVMEREKVG